MAKEIKGIVHKNPLMLDSCCMFTVEQEEETYLVVSTDLQACKDNIFVEQGQQICIKGSSIEDMNFKGVVFTEQAKIKVSRNGIGAKAAIAENTN